VDISAQDGRDPSDDIDKIDTELRRYSPELSERPQIIVANKVDSADLEDESALRFKKKCEELGREVVYVSAITGDGLDELVRLAAERLRDLPPITVYETEITPEDEAVRGTGERITEIRREGGKFIVEGEWLFNFMGQINFSDYESLNFFQRVLQKNGVIDKLRLAGVAEGDTVSIYDFEFDFVY
jgi:GTP-binding protein